MKLETVLIGPSPRIAVDHAGEGPLVVLMHGIGGNRRNWRDQMPVLAQKYHVVAWDARGYGDSDDYEGPLDFADFNRDLLRVIAHFGAAPTLLVNNAARFGDDGVRAISAASALRRRPLASSPMGEVAR